MLTGQTPFYQKGMGKSDLFRAILKARIHPPVGLSADAMSMLGGLLKRNPNVRLGSLKGGESDILDHKWLEEIDSDALFAKEIKPPIVPKIKDHLDDGFFDDFDHLEDFRDKEYPVITESQAEIFKMF